MSKTTIKNVSMIIILALIITTCFFTMNTSDTFASSKSLYKMVLTKTNFTYNGKVQGPGIKVYDRNGNLVSSSNYDIIGVDQCSGCGDHLLKAVGKNGYTGTVFAQWTTNIGSLARPIVKVNKNKATVTVKLPYCSKAHINIFKGSVLMSKYKKYTNTSGSKSYTFTKLKKGTYKIQVCVYAPVCSSAEGITKFISERFSYSGKFVID